MRTSLIIFGVIFLVIGGLLYFMPLQEFSADTSTAGTEGTGTQTSSASVTVPVEWAIASAVIGFVLLIFGLIIPGPVRIVQGPRGPRGSRGKAMRRPARRRRALPRGTTVTTTRVTRTKK